eukprot:21064-Heterococcus_DN1.PRE.1
MAETKPKVLVLIYSMYGHIKQLAEQEKLGLEEAGCEVDIRRAPELLSDEILAKMHASPDLTIPVIDVKDLPSYDGILFGLCTRFGMAAAQMKAVMDATGTLFTSQQQQQQQQLSPQVISMLLLFPIVKSVALCTFQGY